MSKRAIVHKVKKNFYRKEFKEYLPKCGIKKKVSYKNFKSAERFIHKALKYGMSKQKVYKCTKCPYYHLTSQL